MFKYSIFGIVLLFALTVSALATTAYLYPSDDAYVNERWPDNNYGYWAAAHVGYYQSNRYYSALMFDLSAYMGITVNGSTLYVYVWDYGGDSPPDEPIIGRVHDGWSEDAITWNNHPPYDDWHYIDEPPMDDWWRIAMTNWVRQWLNGSHGNHGVYLKAASVGNGFVRVYMKEMTGTTYDPVLVLNYTETSIESASLGEIKAAFK